VIYTHRTGRAGRMGREGTAITFIGDRDLHELKGMFRINRIEPIWDGEEPDLSKARGRSRSGGSGRGGGGRRNSGQNRSGGGNRRRRPRSNQKKTPAKS